MSAIVETRNNLTSSPTTAQSHRTRPTLLQDQMGVEPCEHAALRHFAASSVVEGLASLSRRLRARGCAESYASTTFLSETCV